MTADWDTKLGTFTRPGGVSALVVLLTWCLRDPRVPQRHSESCPEPHSSRASLLLGSIRQITSLPGFEEEGHRPTSPGAGDKVSV